MFELRNLSVLAYANGFTLWHYRGGSTSLAAIRAERFFRQAACMLSRGDMIMASAADGAQVLVVTGEREGFQTASMAG